jgi:hypothetical protein
MPTVLSIGPYSFIFFSSDQYEPPHIHVKRDKQLAKFWLQPIELAKNRGFKSHEINDMERLVHENYDFLVEAWHDYFNVRR